MALDLEDLAVFLVVVREKSFGRAARSLLVSQPTVSERIARMERTIGADVFVRGPRGVALTPSGERLRPVAERIVSLMVEAVETARSADQPPPLQVGVHSTFAYRAVPLVVHALEQPSRSLRVRDAHSDQIIAMLFDRVLDVGFVVPGARPPGLRFDSLPSDPVVCVCAPTHELASARSVPLRTVAQHDVALNLWGAGAHEFADQLRSAAENGRQVECSDASTAVRLAREEGYVAFVVHSAAEAEVANRTLTLLKVRGMPTWSVRLVLATRAKGEIDRDVKSLRQIVRQLAAS